MSDLATRARVAVADEQLQEALSNLTGVLRALGRAAADDDALEERRRVARRVRRETLDDLDGWVARAEAALTATGAVVHHAATPDDARRVVVDLARDAGVDLVVKAKSMATEEVEIAAALEAAGIEALETDLGEYIVQLAGERPSHIIGPAIHKQLPEIARLFSRVAGRALPEDAEALCAFAREELRDRFLAAGMGVTGANFVSADTGTVVLVSNEGNARMCTTWPRVHVAVVPVEKVVPRLADVPTLVQVLTRHASGQTSTTYVSNLTGPRRDGELDGPEQVHVVFLDHGRRALAGTRYEDMLACIRCGACLNACPVYAKIGGHAYDSVYSGPMGAVLTPLLSGGEEGRELPEASSLCGACTDACPVSIPLADHLVHLRADLRRASGRNSGEGDGAAGNGSGIWSTPAADAGVAGGRRRAGFGLWARLWARPLGYRASTSTARYGARLVTRLRGVSGGWAPTMPLARGWAEGRDVPLPARRSFRYRWALRHDDPAAWRGRPARIGRRRRHDRRA